MFTYYRFDKLRSILAVACFASVIFLPWWVPAILVVALCLRFRAWEVVLAGMFMDLYWMPVYPSWMMWSTLPLATLFTVAVLFLLEPLRRQLLVGPEIL